MSVTNEGRCSGFYVGYDLEGGSSYRRECWRDCGCGHAGCPSIDPALPPVPIMHVRSQEGQPYGSERRCCSHCGVSLDDGFRRRMTWGPVPPYMESMADWRARPDRCSLTEVERLKAIARAADDKRRDQPGYKNTH